MGKGVDHSRMLEMVQEIDDDGEGLTKWEIEFISGIIDNGQKFFSQKQADIIKRIYEDRVG